MPGIQNTFLLGKRWARRMAGDLLLVSVPMLRKAGGVGSPELGIPNGLEWRTEDADGVCCEWLTPPNAPADAVLLHLHGGGGVVGLFRGSRWMIGHLALACNLPVLIPDYRLAPENPFPAGVNDGVAAYRWLLARGFDPHRIVLSADSEGGHLVLSTLLLVRDAGQPLPAAAICLSANTDPTCSGESMRTNAYKDSILSPRFARTMMRLYVGNHDLNDPYLSPLRGDLRGLPPMLIQVGSDEVLLDDSRRLNDCAHAAGVDVTLEIWPHMWHGWHYSLPSLPEATQAMEGIARFVEKHLGN